MHLKAPASEAAGANETVAPEAVRESRPYRLARNMRLPFPLLLALRYLRSTRRDAFVTLLSILAAIGIALGVAALIFVLALLSGLQHFLRSDVLARTPHLEIRWPKNADPQALAARVREVPGVVAAQQMLRGRGWLLSGDRPVDVEIVGYEAELPHFFPSPSSSLQGPLVESPPAASSSSPRGLYIDSLTAARWGLGPGDLVELVSPRPTLTPFGPQPRIVKAEIAGTFASGRTETQERRLAVPLATATRLLGKRQTRLDVRAASFEAALELAPRLEKILPDGSELETWKDLNRGLFFALRLEKILMFVSIFLIVPIAAMALVTVLGLLISSKRPEIGMLQAMGARPKELRRAFVVLGSALGFFGLTLGSIVGLGSAWLCDRFRLVRPPGDAYFIDHVPFRLEMWDLLAVLGTTAVLVLLSTAYAAYRAAETRAIEALRM